MGERIIQYGEKVIWGLRPDLVPKLPEGHAVVLSEKGVAQVVNDFGDVFLIALDPPRLIPSLVGNRWDFANAVKL